MIRRSSPAAPVGRPGECGRARSSSRSAGLNLRRGPGDGPLVAADDLRDQVAWFERPAPKHSTRPRGRRRLLSPRGLTCPGDLVGYDPERIAVLRQRAQPVRWPSSLHDRQRRPGGRHRRRRHPRRPARTLEDRPWLPALDRLVASDAMLTWSTPGLDDPAGWWSELLASSVVGGGPPPTSARQLAAHRRGRLIRRPRRVTTSRSR